MKTVTTRKNKEVNKFISTIVNICVNWLCDIVQKNIVEMFLYFYKVFETVSNSGSRNKALTAI